MKAVLILSLILIMISHEFAQAQPADSLYVNKSSEINYKPGSVINTGRFITVVSGVTAIDVGLMAYLQYIWYRDHERVRFEFYNDLGGYNQVDKGGHMFVSYIESYIGYKSLRWAGVSEKKAALYGGSLGFLLQLPVEIWDGMYEGWGFSWSDVAANALGSALVAGQQLAFHDQVVKLKFTFSHSPYADLANGYLGDGFDELFYDYNSHTYWLSTGINRIVPVDRLPDWLNIAVGYSAGGMYGEFSNKTSYNGVRIPETERYRQFLLSLDIDFGRIPVRSKFLKSLFNSMFMVKIPFPAVEFNTLGKFSFYPVYY